MDIATDIATALATGWLLDYLVHSTLIVLLVLGLERLTAFRHPLRRERLWRAALVLALATASVQNFWPAAMGETARGPMTVTVTRTPDTAAHTLDIESASRSPDAAPAVTGSVPAGPSSFELARSWLADHWRILMTWAWIVVAGLLLARLILSARSGLRLLADRRMIREGREQRVASRLAEQAGLDRVPRLSASRRISGPVTLPGAEICLPERALDALPEDRLSAMLAHEMAHVRRRDAEWRLVVNGLCAVLFMQPLNLLVRRKLAGCAELACDDWAARRTGDGRALAECLVEVASWMHPSPTRAFATPMAEHGASLTERVKHLLSGRHGEAGSGWRERGLVVAIFAAVLVAAPGLVVLEAGADPDGWPDGHRSSSANIGDDEMSLSLTTDDRQLKIRIQGEVGFSDAEDEVVMLEDGGRLEIRDQLDGIHHEIVMTGGREDVPELESYEVNGDPAEFDADGRRWLADVIPEIYRMSGLDAEARAGRIFRRDGPEALLEEVELIGGDYVQGLYLAAMFRMDDLDDDELIAALRLAGEEIGSDFELRRTLTVALPILGESTDVSAAYLEAAGSIGSDFEAAELLIASWEHLAGGRQVEDAYFGLAESIGSDFEMRRALEAALVIPWMVETEAARLLELSGRIGSDFEQSEFLIAFAQGGGLSPDDQRALIRRSRDIGSDFEHARTLTAAGRAMDMDPGTAVLLLETAARSIGSDHELAELLLALRPELPEDPAVAAAFEDTAQTLSDHDYGRVMRARR